MPNDELEAQLQDHHRAGDLERVVSLAIGGYGDELFGFLRGLAHDDARADDVFGATWERIWKGLPAFRWESSFRVWAYAIARREFLRTIRPAARREVPVSHVPSIDQAIARLQSTTPAYRQTAVKDRFAKVRAQLPPDDHVLLGLRMDRDMSWSEIAAVLADDGADLTREAATLRKRFERLKTKLRDLLAEPE